MCRVPWASSGWAVPQQHSQTHPTSTDQALHAAEPRDFIFRHQKFSYKLKKKKNLEIYLSTFALAPPQLRLEAGGDRCAGRVEVYHDGKWGTVCDDYFNMRSANVVCRQLNCGQAVSVLGLSYYGPSGKIIHLDDVQCRGTESHLWGCRHAGWGKHNCGLNEDVGVICSGKKMKIKIIRRKFVLSCSPQTQEISGESLEIRSGLKSGGGRELLLFKSEWLRSKRMSCTK